MILAYLILALHGAIIVFNLAGLILIQIGAHRSWPFVRAPVWRMLHLLSWAVVAAQAVAGEACFLTNWQDDLAGNDATTMPLIVRWVNGIIFWPLPLWVFATIYVVMFIYVVALLWLVPPRWSARPRP